MKYGILVSFIACSCIVLSCVQNKRNGWQPNGSANAVTKDIQLNKKRQPEHHYSQIKEKARQLGLDSLQSGYDSLQIRIWMEYSMAKELNIFLFKRKNGTWSGDKITYWSGADLTGYEKIQSKEIENISPKVGWDNFMRQLLVLKVDTLRNRGENISGSDGTSYCVEIATLDKYRYYRFWSPEYDSDKNDQAANMVKIIQLIEREFNFRRNRQ